MESRLLWRPLEFCLALLEKIFRFMAVNQSSQIPFMATTMGFMAKHKLLHFPLHFSLLSLKRRNSIFLSCLVRLRYTIEFILRNPQITDGVGGEYISRYLCGWCTSIASLVPWYDPLRNDQCYVLGRKTFSELYLGITPDQLLIFLLIFLSE